MPKPDEIPRCPDAPARRLLSRHERKYSIRLITPMFGGGVEAGAPDRSLPIRSTAIRGLLQFWWRATIGARYVTWRELFNAHAKVWGTTERASPIEVGVRIVPASKPEDCAKYERQSDGRYKPRPSWLDPFSRWRDLPYALFPFQGSLTKGSAEIERPPAKFLREVSFDLYLRLPIDQAHDVETAVRAWVCFGGIGARTRRGCGSLYCEELAPKTPGEIWKHFPPPVIDAREWPILPGSLLHRGTAGEPLDAWNQVIGLLKNFRQGEGFARNPGNQGRPGRSRFPEPETIRELTRADRRRSGHPRLSHIPADAFPRAELGLPIVFHFQGQGEPPDTDLYPSAGPDRTKRDRMASPLILKPMALASGQAVPMILRLAAPPLDGVELRQGGRPLQRRATTAIRDPHLATYANSPLAASPSGSALEAFLSMARTEGFQEVRR